ncbi:MAG: type II 3-dehydroquinate dehydratase [Clostridiales bacterium]|nr:type II 3-dehydroquinate dehydratase [Clostridiales bacterium]
MKILVINGPNLNMLGIREPGIYGNATYDDLCEKIYGEAEKLNMDVEIFQSNFEGEIVSKIQEAYFDHIDGIIINPAAYTHTSIAILDALKAAAIPAVEVHISDINEREDFRRISYAGMACEEHIVGHGFDGYLEALRHFA